MARERKYQLHDGKMGAAITVQIITRSKRNEIAEILDDGTLKIRLATPKDDHQVNQALIDFLADVLTVKPESLEIIAGQNSQDKLVTVLGLDAKTVQGKILQYL